MKMRRAIAAFLAALCIWNLLGIQVPAAAAAGVGAITAKTESEVRQGDYGYVHVYIDDLKDLASVNVAVHFDPEKIRVVEVLNQVECDLYDASEQDGSLQFSYIFDGEGSTGQTELFSFRYQVLEGAPTGSTWFDILVGDACDKNLKDMQIRGSRCPLRITKKSAVKNCTITATKSISTTVGKEFTIDYRLSTDQVASGAFAIVYDPELFTCVDWTDGKLLENMLSDVNIGLSGTVYVSFAGTSYGSDTQLGSITFRTLKNDNASAKIQIIPLSLYDLNLRPVVGKSASTDVRIQFDANAVEPNASMVAQAIYDAETEQVTLTVRLGEESHLGAGDFRLEFDSDYLILKSWQKEFEPSYFMVNDKKAEEGLLKFSLISLSDITTAETVLTAVFDTVRGCQEQDAIIALSGSGLTNSLTERISLNFVSGRAIIPEEHSFTSDCDETCDLCDYTRAGGEHDLEHHEGRAVTCTEIGWEDYDTCRLCDYTTYLEIPATGHNYIPTVTAPSCIQGGYTTNVCSNCYDSFISDRTEPEYLDGHRFENGLCQECGLPDGAVASGQCGKTLFWSYFESGRLVIYGQGTMNHFYSGTQPWAAYKDSITAVEIRAGVTSVGEYAFYQHTALKDLLLPEGITSLGQYAFGSCSQLEELVLPGTITTIGNYCFRNCSNLRTVNLPEGLVSIGDRAFYSSALETVVFPRSLEKIGSRAFHISQLKEAWIPENVTSIGNLAFTAYTQIFCTENSTAHSYATQYGNPVCAVPAGEALGHDYTAVVTAPTCTEQGFTTHTCIYCSHSYVDTYVESLGHHYGAWYQTQAPNCIDTGLDRQDCTRCDHYETRVVPLADHSFSDGSCRVCGIPEGYTDSGKCGNTVYWVYYESGKLVVYGRGDMANYSENTMPWADYSSSITSVEIREGVTTIGSYAFIYHRALKNLVLPEGLTGLEKFAFFGCSELEAVVLPSTLKTIGRDAFDCCYKLKNVNLPEGLVSIGSWAFSSCAMETVVFPRSLKSIGSAAFSMSGLKEAWIPENVTSIGSVAFYADTWILCHENSAAHTYAKNAGNPICAVPSGEALGHRFTAAVTAPTCTEKGFTTHSCSCGYSYKDTYVDALGHSYTDVVTAPTCTEQGYTIHTCYCGYSYTDTYVKALGHSYGDWYHTLSPNCTETGTERHDCVRCGHYEERTAAATGHSYTDVVTAPTCTEKGYTTHTCHCGHSYVDAYVNALGHTYGVWYQIYAPDCSEEGLEQHDCARCGHEESRSIAPLYNSGHTMVDGVCTACGIADGELATGQCGSSVYWNYYEGGKLVIFGKGAMENFSYGEQPWKAYKDTITVAEVRSGVTTLGSYSFYDYSKLAQVSLPEGLVSLGGSVFSFCDILQTVEIPTTVRSINSFCFAYAYGLKTITIPEGVTTLNYRTFGNCGALEEVILPESLKTIGEQAFRYCGKLKEIRIPDGVTSIYSDSFDETLRILCHENTTAHNHAQTYGNPFCAAPVDMPIGHVHNSVVTQPTCTEKGYTTHTCGRCGYSFADTYLDALGHSYGNWYETLAPTCTKTGKKRHDCTRCDHYEEQTVAATGHSYTDVVTAPTCTAQGYTTHTCHCGHSYTDTYVNALGHSYGSWYEILAPTCTETGMERRDCTRCDHYEEQTVAAAGHSYTDVVTAPTCTARGYTTHTCHCGYSYKDTYVKALGHSYGSWYVSQAPSCTEQGTDRRDCVRCDHYEEQATAATGHSYTHVVTAPTCTAQGYTTHTCHCGHSYVDAYVNALGHTYGIWYQIYAPDCSEEGLEQHDCARCGYEESRPIAPLYNSGHTMVNGVCTACGIADGELATGQCGNSVFWNYYSGGKLVIFGSGKMTDFTEANRPGWEAYAQEITSAEIRSGVTTIGEFTFLKHGALTRVETSDTLEKIGESAFEHCQKLNSVTLHSGLTHLGWAAFWWCTNLHELEIPATVTRIEGFCFTGCASLRKVVLPAGLTTLEGYAFYSCTGVEEVVLPETITKIPSNCFSGCYDLKTIRIPDSVTTIENYAFSNCSSLEEIRIPDSVTSIQNAAFGNTTRIVCHEGSAAHSYALAKGNPCCAAPADAPIGHSFVYQDNADGTHSHICDLCGLVDGNSEIHDFTDGNCVCGAEKPARRIGDLDLDGDVDSDDLTMLARHVGGIEMVTGQALANADVNGDGRVDSDDLTKHARYVGGIITGWDQN